jgi:hypothetical protein
MSYVSEIQPLSFRWSKEFVAQIDAARGDVPRSTAVRRAVEAWLTSQGAPTPAPVSRMRPSSAQSKAHVLPIPKGATRR